MKLLYQYRRYALLAVAFLFMNPTQSIGQSKKDPAAYMEFIGDRYAELSLEFYKYMSAVAHSHNGRKIERKRQQLLATSWDTYTTVRTMSTFKGDRALRDSAATYLRISHRVLKEDYDKILNLEVIAERSYDDMEAYIMAQKEARNKLDISNVRMLAEQKKFAAKHRMTLTSIEDELYDRMKQTNSVLSYLNMVYLTFFKSHKQEIYLLEALSAKDEKALEQNRNMLKAYVLSGTEQLESIGSFRRDASLKNACIQLHEFYMRECKTDVDRMIKYIHAEKDFEREKVFFDQLSKEERNEVQVNVYNAAVRKLNEAANQFNTTSQDLHEERTRLNTAWKLAYEQFLSNHIPHF